MTGATFVAVWLPLIYCFAMIGIALWVIRGHE